MKAKKNMTAKPTTAMAQRRTKTWRVIVRRYFGSEMHVFDTMLEAISFAQERGEWLRIEAGAVSKRQRRIRRVVGHV